MKNILRNHAILEKIAASRNLLLMLDFDGTLSPIISDPARSKLPPAQTRALRRLRAMPGVTIAIISGRDRKSLRGRIPLRNIIMATSHGCDITGPGIRLSTPMSARQRALMDRFRKSIIKETAAIPGVLIENKAFSFTLHYRMIKPVHIKRLMAIFKKEWQTHNKSKTFLVKSGKKVLEIMPANAWDKGQAVRQILGKQTKTPLPVYLGDDRPDEAAFQAVRRCGVGIKIGKPGKSAAKWYLSGVAQVQAFLEQLVIIREKTKNAISIRATNK